MVGAAALLMEILPEGRVEMRSPWYDQVAFHQSLLDVVLAHTPGPGCPCAVEAFR